MLLTKDQKIGSTAERMLKLESKLQALQQRAITEESVEKQVDELIKETSLLRVQLAEAESEKQGVNQEVKHVQMKEKALEEEVMSLQQVTTVSVHSYELHLTNLATCTIGALSM